LETLAEMLASSVRHFGERPYIVAEDRTLTFRQFDAVVCRMANVMAGHGIGKGDPVGLYLPSCPMLAVGYYACQKLGAIAVPMSAMNRDREIRSIVERTKMRLMLADGETSPHVVPVRDDLGLPGTLLVLGGSGEDGVDCDSALRDAPEAFTDVACQPSDPVGLFFTSGTTGEPKGAVHTQLSQYSTLRDMTVYNRFLRGREVLMNALPLFNNFGATCLMNASVFSAGTMVMIERWDTEKVLELIQRHRATYIAGSPTMFLYLLREYDSARHDLSSIRLGVTGGAPVSPNVVEQFQDAIGAPLVQIYGATEVTGYVTGEPPVGVRRRGSAGVPIGATRIEIVDDDGVALPAGETGEIRIAGDVVGGGYWRDPDATEAAFTPSGWLSGDLGHVDEDGYLYVVDRKKDVIITAGFNIYPLEVEDLLYTHPDVAVCALIGLPDEEKGAVPVVVVLPKQGHHITAKGIIDFCREHLSAYKAPRAVYTVEEMPLGPTGKILKRKLRDWGIAGTLRQVA
jgi:long-chain acyl-CoA synthetase